MWGCRVPFGWKTIFVIFLTTPNELTRQILIRSLYFLSLKYRKDDPSFLSFTGREHRCTGTAEFRRSRPHVSRKRKSFSRILRNPSRKPWSTRFVSAMLSVARSADVSSDITYSYVRLDGNVDTFTCNITECFSCISKCRKKQQILTNICKIYYNNVRI